MKKLDSFDLTVIGGGITGLGVARKAAEKGYKVLLIEKNDIGSGTSGHFHESLHSGARYAVNDLAGAKECFVENQRLRSPNSLVRNAIDQTGGYLLALTDEEVLYSEQLIAACQTIGIPIVEKNVAQFLKEEPLITKLLKRVLRVPDGRINGEKTLAINKHVAQEFGTEIVTHHKVVGFQIKKDRIEAVTVKDKDGTIYDISCGFVINASGAWSTEIGRLAGITIALTPYRGAIISYKGLLCKSVLNRCHLPGDGDIVVPADTHTIFGTTSKKTTDVDDFTIQKDEIAILQREGDLLIPGLSKHPVKNMYAGVRPLIPVTDSSDGRKLSRSFRVIDHREDGISNFLSVIGGKFLLYELMGDKAIEAMEQNIKMN